MGKIEDIYRNEFDGIVRWARHLGARDAEGVVQEAFLATWQKQVADPIPYVKGCVRRMVMNENRELGKFMGWMRMAGPVLTTGPADGLVSIDRCARGWLFHGERTPKQPCAQCGKLFKPRSSKYKCCSHACGVAHRSGTLTHCKNGHEWTPENTAVWRGKRACKECQRNQRRAYEARNPGRKRRHA